MCGEVSTTVRIKDDIVLTARLRLASTSNMNTSGDYVILKYSLASASAESAAGTRGTDPKHLQKEFEQLRVYHADALKR